MLKDIFKNQRKSCVSEVLGFSLAEATITLAVLGVIAAITIPSIISRNTENTKRVKLKKAVEVYSNAIITMVEENNIKVRSDNNIALDGWGSENDCANVRQYFKIIKNGKTNCQFRTSDGVWWSFGGTDNNRQKIGSLSKALVAFKESDLTKAKAIDEESTDAFFLMTIFDDKKKARILDVAYSNYTGDSASIINTAKVYAFLNKKEMKDYYVFCPDKDHTKSCIESFCTNNGERDYCTLEYHDPNGKYTSYRSGCKNKLIACTAGQYKSRSLGNNYHFAGNCDTQGADCIYYIMHYDYVDDWMTKGPTPDFDKVDNKNLYSNFKLRSDVQSWRDCDFYAQSIKDCKQAPKNLLSYRIPNDPDGTFMNVYYTEDSNGNKKIESIGISHYPGTQAAISLITYQNCTGWDIKSCKTCKSMSTKYPCP